MNTLGKLPPDSADKPYFDVRVELLSEVAEKVETFKVGPNICYAEHAIRQGFGGRLK